MSVTTALSEHGEKLLMGLVALPYVIYKVYQTVKSDTKGDNLDARIESFSQKLQTQLDAANKRCDDLQIAYAPLAVENATLKTRIANYEETNLRLRGMLEKALDSNARLKEAAKNVESKVSVS